MHVLFTTSLFSTFLAFRHYFTTIRAALGAEKRCLFSATRTCLLNLTFSKLFILRMEPKRL